MDKNINTILIPVQFDAEHLSVVRQAALLAKEHKAMIHLLAVKSISSIYNFSYFTQATPVKNTFFHNQEQLAMLETWKRWLEQDYGIKVTPVMELGNWKDVVLKYAISMNADLVVLKDKPVQRKWFTFRKSPIEYLIAKCPCQVLTLYSNKTSMAEWKDIVIPITDFIPEQRVHTILKLAKVYKFKIHLIASPINANNSHPATFHFFTETLKMLKPSGNIQVQCEYLDEPGNQVHRFVEYTNRICADALMTKMKDNRKEKVNSFIKKLENFFNETPYGKYPDTIFPAYH